jgi:hypothetical protein
MLFRRLTTEIYQQVGKFCNQFSLLPLVLTNGKWGMALFETGL